MYQFTSVLEGLIESWPSQKTLIKQQVHRYTKNIESMAQNLHHLGSVIQPQHLNDDGQLNLESPSSDNDLSLRDDGLCYVNDSEFDDGYRNDNYIGRTVQVEDRLQDTIASALLGQSSSYLSCDTGSEYLQEQSRYPHFYQNTLCTDEHHINTTTTIDPATISLLATNCVPSTNDHGVPQSVPFPPTLACRTEFEAEIMNPVSCSKRAEGHKNASRRASCQRQHKLNHLPNPWTENELTDSISQDLRGIAEDRIGKIRLLYSSIGGESSLLQLKGILSMIRDPHTLTFKCNETNGRKIFQSLEDLDATTNAYGLKRRILFLRFIEYRDRRFQELEQDRPASRKRPHNSPEPALQRRLASEVLNVLVREICPRRSDADQELFENDKKKIKNLLGLARHWQRATKRIGLGIFALIPTGRSSGIQNTTYASESKTFSVC